jgi:hypothetical protein
MAFLKEKHLEISQQEMAHAAQIIIALPQSKSNELIIELKSILAGDFIENLDFDYPVNGFIVERVTEHS